MTAFHKRSWEARYAAMGDEAESLFQLLHPASAPFGLRRPPVNLTKVPPFIRYMPDFLMHDRLVECMGVGKDQLLKLKIEKLVALETWAIDMPVWLFVWDSHVRRWADLPLSDVQGAARLSDIKTFPEGKHYYSIPLDVFAVDWTVLPLEQAA